MASTLLITVKSNRSTADLARFVKAATTPRDGVIALSKFFTRAAAGLETCSIDVQTGAAPVRASGTLTLTYASITTGDTCVIAGRTLTCVTGTPAATQQWKKVTDATVTAAGLVTLINSDAVTKLVVSATSALGVVTITALTAGEEGNFVTVVGSTGMVASAATLASGVGGADSVKVTYSRGL
jgi:hypothetical protein